MMRECVVDLKEYARAARLQIVSHLARERFGKVLVYVAQDMYIVVWLLLVVPAVLVPLQRCSSYNVLSGTLLDCAKHFFVEK
jgi:hypothetical protein